MFHLMLKTQLNMRKIDFNFSPCLAVDIGKLMCSGWRFKGGVYHTFSNQQTEDIFADVNKLRDYLIDITFLIIEGELGQMFSIMSVYL